MIPSWMRSSSDRPWPWYFFAIETTRRRFELIILSFACLVAALDPLRELDLLRRGQQRVAAGLVEEQLQRVGRHRRDVVVRVVRLVLLRLGNGAVVDQVDAARLELLVEARELLVVELELGDELVERGEVDAALLLAVLQQDPQLVLVHLECHPQRYAER